MNNDIIPKWIIMKSFIENAQIIEEGQENSAYRIWNSLKEYFTNIQAGKLELKAKLEKMKYNNAKDINIFMAKITISELEKFNDDLCNNTKTGILIRAFSRKLMIY